MRNKNYILGIVLIAFGIIGIISRVFNLHIFYMSTLWPLFVLIPGLCFEYAYFRTRKNPGLLVPGGILTTIGLLFLFEVFTGWRFAGKTWPIYILAVAIGLFQLYMFGGRQKALLIPISILTAVALSSIWAMTFGHAFRWFRRSLGLPILLVLIGIIILFSGKQNSKAKDDF